MCQPVLKFHLWQMLISNGATLKLSYKAFLKDFKVKANFQPRLKSQNNAFYKIYQAFKILFGDLNNLFFFNSFEPQKCSFNMNLPFFWCLMSIMTHDAKPIQISSKTTIWVLRCKKEVRFSFHFFFQLNFFFSFAASKVGQLLNWKRNTKPTWENKEHDPLAKAKFKLVIKSNVFEKVHDHHPTCFSKSNKRHHANHGSITTYQPSKWLANIDVFP